MGRRKIAIKNNIHSCFYCGKHLSSLKDKIIHRVNQKKNISENNIVILCPKCKYKFSLGGFKIYNINVGKESLKLYFENLEKDYKDKILKSLQLQRDRHNEEDLF